MKERSHVLMIGLDAADVTLIDRLCLEGKLRTLQSLRDQGCFGSLEADATIFSGGVWPTFYTSKRVPWHGIYHNRIWRHEYMRSDFVSETWLSERPFWEILNKDKFQTTVIDVPLVVTAPKQGSGICLAGWGTHDLIFKSSLPADLWKRLETEFGPPVMPPELYGPQSVQTLLQLKDILPKTIEQTAHISEFLLAREPWDLFLVVLGATHRGGHYLWDLSQTDEKECTPEIRQILNHALIDIYQACDDFIARLIKDVPAKTKILVFAVHGMGLNPGWSDRCVEILARIQHGRNEVPKTSALYKLLSRAMLRSLKHQTIKHLPQGVRNRLFGFRRLRELDWGTLRYFPLPMDHAGYLRVNLKGREPHGIIEPGKEYDELCQQLGEAFLSFRDIDTGEAIAAKIYRMDDLAPRDAPYRELLPDLVIVWSNRSAIRSRGIRSGTYGEIRWKTGKLASGRSGNHQDKAWFVAVGDGIPTGTREDDHHIVDLVPTVFQWLGAEQGTDFQGKPIPALCGD